MKMIKILHIVYILVLIILTTVDVDGQTLTNVTAATTSGTLANPSTSTVCNGVQYQLSLSVTRVIKKTAGIAIISTVPASTGPQLTTFNSTGTSPIVLSAVIFTVTGGAGSSSDNIVVQNAAGNAAEYTYNFTVALNPLPLTTLNNNIGTPVSAPLVFCDDGTSTANFTSNCDPTASTAVNNPCYVGAGFSYAWTFSNGTATSSVAAYSVPRADLILDAINTATLIMKNGNPDASGAYCTTSSTIQIEVRSKPNIGPILYDGLSSKEICVYGNSIISTSLNNAYGGETYGWRYRGVSGGYKILTTAGTLPGHAITLDPAATGTGLNRTKSITIEPEMAPYDKVTRPIPRIPVGPTDIRAVVSNIYGCHDSIVDMNKLIINDRPAVMIYNNLGGGSFNSADGQVVCPGQQLTLRQHYCTGAQYNYANMDSMNYSVNPTSNDPNVTFSLGVPRPYTSPCNGGYFNKLTWTAIAQNGTTNLTSTLNAGGLGVGNNVVTSFSSDPLHREVTLTTTQNGGTGGSNLVTYRLEVEGVNGCTNSDYIRITTQDAPITFESGPSFNAVPLVAGNPTVTVCKGSAPVIRGLCPSCNGSKGYTWTRISGLGSITSGSGSEYVTLGGMTGAVGTQSVFEVVIEGSDCKGAARVTVTIGNGPDISLTPQTVCEGQPLTFVNADPNGADYTLVKGFASNPSGGSVPNITGVALSGANITAPAAAAGSHIYWFSADYLGCKDTTFVSFTVRPTPHFDSLTPFGLTYPTYNSECNDKTLKFVVEASGGTSSLSQPLNYRWVVRGITTAGAADSINNPMGTESSGGSGGGYYTWVFSGWYPRLVWVPFPPSEKSYTFDTGHPTQKWTSAPSSGVELIIVVSDINGCSITDTWKFDILECGVPSMSKYKGATPGTTLPNHVPFKYYGCLNQTVTLEVTIPAPIGYADTYEWRQAHRTGILGTTNLFAYPINNSDPDTIFTVCTVYKPVNDSFPAGDKAIVNVLFDTTIISRGFADVYPHPQSVAPDTTICLNDVVQAHANCPPCRGNIEYVWGSDTTGFKPFNGNGNIWDTHLFPSTGAGTTFPVALKLRHGEGCVDNFTRQVYVNDLPSVSLIHNGAAVSNTNPIYLCNGAVDIITIDTTGCPTCGTSTYQWNTGANTLSINVSSQGGYYAEVIDGNFCKGATNYAIVIEANEGLNSPAIANPTQLCGGGDATLEVAPCPGCTYTWHNVNPMPTGTQIAATRTHTINTVGNYYAQVRNAQGCVYPTSQISVTATTLTIPSISGTTDSLCFGEMTTLSTPSITNASYQWYRNGSILSGATNRTYTTGNAGTYKVAVTNPNGCIKESPLFNVYAISFKPNIIAATTVVCSGATADLSTNLYSGWQYQWFDDGNSITGATGSIYSATTPGSHYVQVTTNYGCIMRSDSIDITTSSLPNPTTSTSTPSVCPGEYGKVSVSLCTGCSYQWFDANTGLSITIDTVINYRFDSVIINAGIPNEYYCIVSGGGCSERSDTVEIIYNSIFTPAINTSSNFVCDGQNPLLITPGCVGCSYSWLLNGSPVLGALNDTFHYVTNPKDSGLYEIAVTYSNGCADTSAPLKISDGSYGLTLDAQSGDYIICNGDGEDLEALATSSAIGTFFYTLFLNNTPVTGYTNVTSNVFPNRNIAGVYTVQSIDSRNCKELSNFISLDTVTVEPVLKARATSNISSVNASAICDSLGTVFLEVTNCPGCAFTWDLNGSPYGSPVWTQDTLTSQLGAAGTGTYIVNATKSGCSAPSNPKFVANLISITPSPLATASKNSICDGESVVLQHIASNGNPALNCPGCSFRWLRGAIAGNSGNSINGASSYQYVAGTPGYYYLEMTTTQGCVDTSQVVVISKIDPPVGFVLNFDSVDVVYGTGTPLASNGSSIDMNYWVYPTSVRNAALLGTDSSYFTNAPFSGALLPNAGLSGVNDTIFTPDDTLSGNHLITYHYITQGCEFTVQDVIEVLPPAAITVTNANPSSVPYEACVSDQLTISTTNLNYPIDEVYAFDNLGNYILMPLSSTTISSDTFGVSVRWNSTIVFNVPGSANASYLMLVNSATNDTTFTSFVLIHNTDLSFTGLPSMLCSNGTPITLLGNPSGGTFTVRDTTPAHNTYPGIVTGGNILNSTSIPTTFYVNGSQMVDVFYAYTETYTNGNACPSFDTVSQRMEVKDVRLTSVTFNTISVSQSQELLTNLVKNVVPYRARANKPNYTVSYAGSFTFPAGNPTHFLPKNAGVGTHPLTYKIKSGDCINSVASSITVKAAPTPMPMPDTICRNHGMVTYSRAASGTGYIYPNPLPGTVPVNSTTTYTDTLHIMKVYSKYGNAGIVWNNTNPGVESFNYDPSLVAPNKHDTLVIEYWFSRREDTTYAPNPTGNFDNLKYIVGRIYKPIYIEDLDSVAIDTSIVKPFYCQANTLNLLAGNPTNNDYGGGRFMLYGGNGQYAMPTGDTLLNNVINPYQVNSSSSPNGVYTYDLVYILNGAVCKNSDTMQITISKLLTPSFATINGKDEFCDTDPNVAILHNVMAPDTAIWKIGGVPQASYVFPPDPLDPGTHVVELQMRDSFLCTASVKDTFFINPLPALDTTPALAPHYCANDPVLNFVVSPSPGCPSYLSPGHVQLNERFLSGIPPNWNVANVVTGKPWVATNVLAEGGTGTAAFIDTGSVKNNSWLISAPINMVAGHTYRLTYMVRAGKLDPTCAGLCDASLQVLLDTAGTTNVSGQIDFQPAISNDQTYIRYEVEHYHDPAFYSTRTYYLRFRSTTEPKGRSLRLDNIRMRDLSIENCNLNGIGYITGAGVHNVKDSLYQFNPLAVTPGNIEVKYIYTTVKGCQDSLVIPITVDSFPIVSFTNMDSSYCLNHPTIMLTGSPLGGRFTETFSVTTTDSNLIHIPFTAPLDTAWYPVNYQTNVSGTGIVSYTFTDRNGCSSTAKDTVVIVGMPDTAVVDNALDPFGIGHCLNAAPSVLNYTGITGAPLPGWFYGAGVRNGLLGPGAATFHPDSAALDMGHTGDVVITYIYPTSTNCMDTTRFTTHVHAMPDLSFMNLPDSMCLNADTFQLLAINTVVTGSMGQIVRQDTLGNQTGAYVFTDIFGNVVPNFMGLFDSIRPPAAMGLSQVNVQYTHTVGVAQGACTSTIYDSIRIDTVPVVYFQGMKPFYCENEPPSILLAFPPYKVGSGYMMLDSVRIDSSFYWIDPLVMVGAGSTTHVYPSYYTYTDTRGCRGEVYDTFEVRPFPRITFSSTFQDTFCRVPGSYYNLMQEVITPKGGRFTDNLALTSIVNDSLLDLGSIAGPRLVTYHFIDTTTACYNNDSIWLYLFNGPQLAFDALGGCSNMDITFDGYASNLVNGIDSITRIWWVFDSIGAPGLTVNSSLDTSPVTLPDILHQYTNTGTYRASLFVENQGNCVASVSKDIIISPTVAMLPTPYFQDFNAAGVAGAGEWYADKPISVSASNIWSHQPTLGGTKINSSNGAWVTAADTLYGKGQKGWVYSPCFDFTNAQRPMIAFDLWRDMLSGIDGVVMEYYDGGSNSWKLLGDKDFGINWYQSNFVLARPGNQQSVTYPRGWTGRGNGFESARFRLDQFKGRNHVRFRIAFGTAQQTVNSLTQGAFEGAAFDNVWVGERTRNVLVEHFNNISYSTQGGNSSDVVDRSVYDTIFNSAYGLDVVLAQYQTSIKDTLDPINRRNNADPSARVYLYGIQSDNECRIDGRLFGTGVSEKLKTYDLDYEMLQFPAFNISITTPIIQNNVLTVNSTVTALKKMPKKDYAVHTVVIQDSMNINARGFEMLSVVRKMLPNAGGETFNQEWLIGAVENTNAAWDFTSEIGKASFNPNQLEVVVFIQNMDSKEIYQVQTTQDLTKYTGVGQLEEEVEVEVLDMKVYPNPSSDYFNVEFDRELEGTYNWKLVDVTGRILQIGTAEQGTKNFMIDADRLTNGAYFFVITNDKIYAQRKLVVIK